MHIEDIKKKKKEEDILVIYMNEHTQTLTAELFNSWVASERRFWNE